MLIDANGRLLGRWNLLDAGTVLTVVLIVLGSFLVQGGWHKTSGQVVQGENDIVYTIVLKNVKTQTSDLFKPGEALSLTIRNQPRGQVNILSVQKRRHPLVVTLPNGSIKVVDDPTEDNSYDYVITLKDHAQRTKDGYVAEGIKVKIGMTIDVEGFNYRLPAMISNIQALP